MERVKRYIKEKKFDRAKDEVRRIADEKQRNEALNEIMKSLREEIRRNIIIDPWYAAGLTTQFPQEERNLLLVEIVEECIKRNYFDVAERIVNKFFEEKGKKPTIDRIRVKEVEESLKGGDLHHAKGVAAKIFDQELKTKEQTKVAKKYVEIGLANYALPIAIELSKKENGEEALKEIVEELLKRRYPSSFNYAHEILKLVQDKKKRNYILKEIAKGFLLLEYFGYVDEILKEFIPDEKERDEELKEIVEELSKEGNPPNYFECARKALNFISNENVKNQLEKKIEKNKEFPEKPRE
jgi:hypothetical protein